jgi:hypothetical protein
MSAINPASFVTPPTPGLPGPGPGQMPNPLYTQEAPDRRHQQDGRQYGARDLVDTGREMQNPVSMLRTAYSDSYQPFTQASRPQDSSQSDPFAPYSPGGYGLDGAFDYGAAGAASNSATRMHPAQGEWVGRFQGLSLNS